MNSDTYKPHTSDNIILSDIDSAISHVLSSAQLDLSTIDKLPLSSFSNYTAKKENLNLYQVVEGVKNNIGNDLIYVSAGDSYTSYTTGNAVSPPAPTNNLLNRYNATINYIPKRKRHTRNTLGGYFLPDKLAPLTYASFSFTPMFLEERMTPGETYVVPDPTLYGSGYGNTMYGTDSPVDHVEDNSWLKAHPINIGMRGRIVRSERVPQFYNYTSNEITLGAPAHGISKFTDNYDFWAGSKYSDIWANADVYQLREANKFYLTERSAALLTDLCDSPYRWRTDIYGNTYALFKPGTTVPRRVYGGSDIDGDGKDDVFTPGDPRSKPERDLYDGSPDGVDPGGIGGGDPDGGLPPLEDPKESQDHTIECNGEIIQQEWDGEQWVPASCSDELFSEPDTLDGQLPVRECKYWLFGGDSLSPTSSATNLDTPETNTTQSGSITAIIDGGWRPLRTGSQTDYTPSGSSWPIAGSEIEDQTDNAHDIIGSSGYPNYANGFFDRGMFEHQLPNYDTSPEQGVGDTEEVEWLPDYTRTTQEVRKYPIAQFDKDGAEYTVTSTRTIGDDAYRASGRTEEAVGFKYHLADGGWYQPDQTPQESFFQTQCDRAGYIVAQYGADGKPSFGNHLFACHIWDITDNPGKYIKDWAESPSGKAYLNSLPEFSRFPEGTKRNVEIQKEITKQVRRAEVRGPLNALQARNPIEWMTNGLKHMQFFGRRNHLEQHLKNQAIRNGDTGFDTEALKNFDTIPGYDYLQDFEYQYMRISPIEGSGVGTVGDIGSLYFTDETTGTTTDTAKWTELSALPVNSPYQPGIKGDPDYFYYVSGGSYDKPGQGTLNWVELSGTSSYIKSFAQDKDDQAGTRVIVNDTAGDAAQFPQVPHTDYSRDFSISIDKYNSLNCRSVSEYRVYDGLFVANSDGEIAGNVTTRRKVWGNHPEEQFHDLVLDGKRGYWPPPVANLRRTQTYSDVTGTDAPINNNILPDVIDDGFYVHDVWDAGSFVAYLENVIDYDKKTSGKTDEEPEDTGGSGDVTNDDDECRKTMGDVVGVKKWRKNAFGECVPATCAAGYALNMDNNTCEQIPGWTPGGGGGDDDTRREECYTCAGLDGDFYIREDCGDYAGFKSGAGGQVNPCYPDKLAPLEDISRMRKFYSDQGDFCAVDEIPTLWEQKHLPLTLQLNKENAFFRNIYNKVANLTDILQGLYTKYQSVNASEGVDVLTSDEKLIDLDVVYDALVLRQKNNDIESYIIDKIEFDHESEEISTGSVAANYIITTGEDTSQLITHFFNEDEREIVVGVIRHGVHLDKPSSSPGHAPTYPELYCLNLDTFNFDRVFPRKEYEPQSETDFIWNASVDYYKNSGSHETFDDLKLFAADSEDIPLTAVDPGEISYNPDTGNYCVTYIGYVSHDTDNVYPVIHNSIFKRDGHRFKPVHTTKYVPENTDNITVDSELSEFTDKKKLLQGEQSTETVQTSGFEYRFELDLGGLDANVIWLDVDWGDGESIRVYSDFHNSLDRYKNFTWIGDNSYVDPDTTGAPDQEDVSLIRHTIGHIYRFTGDGSSYNINIRGNYLNNTTTFDKTIVLDSQQYSINQVTQNRGVKMLSTKLFTSDHDKKEKLIMTMETQGGKRYISTHMIPVQEHMESSINQLGL